MEQEIKEIEENMLNDVILLNALSLKYEIIGLDKMSDEDKLTLVKIIQNNQFNKIRLALLETKIEHAEYFEGHIA